MTPRSTLSDRWDLVMCVIEFCWHARRELSAFLRDLARLLWAVWRTT